MRSVSASNYNRLMNVCTLQRQNQQPREPHYSNLIYSAVVRTSHLALHQYIIILKHVPLQYMANHPYDPIKDKQVQASVPCYPAFPRVWGKIIGGIKKRKKKVLSEQTESHFHLVFGLSSKKKFP